MYGRKHPILPKKHRMKIFLHFRFFVYEVTSTKFTRELVKEVLLSVIASIFMGFGTLFLLLWVGIFV